MSIVNNTIIRPPVSIYDVRKILGNQSVDLGTLCLGPTINKWAKYKPVKHNGVGLLTDQQRKNVNFGITNIPVWTGNGALNKMGNFWFGVDTSSTNYPVCGIQAEYWGYQRPTGGRVSPYRLTDFVKDKTSIYGYKHDVVAPIGECEVSEIRISCTGWITIPFGGHGSGQTDGYTVPLGELSGEGVSTGDFNNLYMAVMIHLKGSNIYYVATRPDVWSAEMITSVSSQFLSAADGEALVGICEVFPFLSTSKYSNPTHNLSGAVGPAVAMFEKSEVGVSIQYAEGSISEFVAYYENLTDKLLYYAFALTNDSVEGGFRAAYTVEFSPSILFPSGDTLTASGDVFLPFGQSTPISRSITIADGTAAHFKNGYARITVNAQAGYDILYKRQTTMQCDITQGLPR
jgi:hypothetical protein